MDWTIPSSHYYLQLKFTLITNIKRILTFAFSFITNFVKKVNKQSKGKSCKGKKTIGKKLQRQKINYSLILKFLSNRIERIECISFRVFNRVV